MRVMRRLLCLALALALALAVGDGGSGLASASPLSANGRLQVKGKYIVNKKGTPFVIKGVSTHGIAWYPQYVNKSAFASLKKRGVNTVRLAMYTEEYGGYCNSGRAKQKELKKLLDKGVQAAASLGMYVIIDWHILSDGNPLKHRAQAKKFFRETARRYASRRNVLYEICNEPNGGGGSWKNIRKYAKEIIRVIRSEDRKAVIIVGTPTWSQDVDVAAEKPLSGKNIVYAFHFYAATHREELRKKLTAAVKKGLPVLVSEFGITEASGNGTVSVSQGNRWIKLLNKYKIGRVCWNLSNKGEKSALLKSRCRRVSGWKSSDFTKQGRWLWKQYR